VIACEANPGATPSCYIGPRPQSVRRRWGVELSAVDVREPREIERAVTAFVAGLNGGLIVTSSGFAISSSRADHQTRGTTPFAHGLPVPLLRHRRRLDLLRARSD
jgi:hypothetical protein